MATPALGTDDIITAIQIGGKSGKPLFFPIRGRCETTAADDIRGAIQVGGLSAKPLLAVGLAQCLEGGGLPGDTPLLGVQIGGKDGKPLFAAGCVTCDGDTDPFFCGCTVCCTLDATVWVPDQPWPFATTTYATPVDVTLTCERSFTRWNGTKICEAPDADYEDPDDFVTVDAGETTYSGTTGTLTSPARDFKSTVWVSDSFDAGFISDPDTWRLVYVHVQTIVTEGEFEGSTSCGLVSILQKLVDGHWCHWGVGYGVHAGAIIPATTNIDDFLEDWCAVDAGGGTCPEGWIGPYGIVQQCRGLCGSAGAVGIPTWDSDTDDDGIMDCPIVAEWEMPLQPNGFTNDWVCCKVQLFDLCEEE